MAMADLRGSRHSPPSILNNSHHMSSFASPSSRRLDAFSQAPNGLSSLSGLSPTLERRSYERSSDSSLMGPDHWPIVTKIRLRRLPRKCDDEALRTMLLFAKDLHEIKLVDSDREDAGFSCAIATFLSDVGAREALDRLNGKPNATKDANMIVEMLSLGSRRNTVDGTAAKQQSGASNSPPNNSLSRQSSRYSSSWQNMGKVSPPLGSPTVTTKDFPAPDGNNRLQNLFSPQSPVANSYPHSNYRHISGKAVINDDNADDETGDILKDPLSYAKNGHQPARSGNPLPNFGGLSLNTSALNGTSHQLTSPGDTSFASSRSLQSPSGQSPVGTSNMGSNGNFPMNGFRHNYPPVNPADQNPPCNTLYVGNLPVDTNEDELKQLFSKVRGFKRLCFRTKHNGPMCFVEFEDITFATKALNDLYGVQLHNSFKGGIRLSFSKNPLGVRSGQNGMGPHTPMSPQAMSPGFNNGMGAPPGFTTANGPPPGLAPPGLRSPSSFVPSPVQDGFGRGYAPQFSGLGAQQRQQSISGGYPSPSPNGTFGSMNGAFSAYSINPVRRG